MSKLRIYTFADLEFSSHHIPGAKRAFIELPNGTNASVVGGPRGLYGNGKTTFEVWYSNEDEPRAYQSIEDINLELAERSIIYIGLL